MESVIVNCCAAISPDDAAEAYIEESKLKQEILTRYENLRVDTEELGKKLSQLRNLLKRRPGRKGSFNAWLKEHEIPVSTAYYAIEVYEDATRHTQLHSQEELGISKVGSSKPPTRRTEALDGNERELGQEEPSLEHITDNPVPMLMDDGRQDSVPDDEDLDSKLGIRWSHEEQKAFNTCLNLLKEKTGREVEKFMWNLYNRVTARFRVSVMNPPAYRTSADRLEVANG